MQRCSDDLLKWDWLLNISQLSSHSTCAFPYMLHCVHGPSTSPNGYFGPPISFFAMSSLVAQIHDNILNPERMHHLMLHVLKKPSLKNASDAPAGLILPVLGRSDFYQFINQQSSPSMQMSLKSPSPSRNPHRPILPMGSPPSW